MATAWPGVLATASLSSGSAPGALPEASCHEPAGAASCSFAFPFFFFFGSTSAVSVDSLDSPTTDQAAGEAAAIAGRAGSIGVTGSGARSGAGAGVHTSCLGIGSKAGGGGGGANCSAGGAVGPTSHGELEGASGIPRPMVGAAAGGAS